MNKSLYLLSSLALLTITNNSHAVISNLSALVSSSIKTMALFDKRLQSKGVFMDQESSIELKAGKTEPKSIFSFGFGGCTGVATYTRHSNGDQRAVLAHYSPLDIRGKLDRLRRLYNWQANQEGEIENSTTVVLHPLDWKKNPTTGKWDQKPQCEVTFELLSSVAKASFGAKSILLPQMYSMIFSLDDNGAPYGQFGENLVPKELEIVLMPNKDDSFWRCKADGYAHHSFSDNNEKSA